MPGLLENKNASSGSRSKSPPKQDGRSVAEQGDARNGSLTRISEEVLQISLPSGPEQTGLKEESYGTHEEAEQRKSAEIQETSEHCKHFPRNRCIQSAWEHLRRRGYFNRRYSRVT